MLRRPLTLALHLAAVLTPMTLGWGLHDLSVFFANPARTGLFTAILAGSLSMLLLKIDLNPLREGGSSDTAPDRYWQSWGLIALALASLALLWFLPRADRLHLLTFRSQPLRWLGLVFCCTGGLIRILALRALGSQFSAYVTLQPGHRLIRHGVYSIIRHPLYLSLLLGAPGLALVFASQLVWPILAATTVFICSRIPAEDALLAQAFALEFELYQASTPAILPML